MQLLSLVGHSHHKYLLRSEQTIEPVYRNLEHGAVAEQT
jgi:hypothetical protein